MTIYVGRTDNDLCPVAALAAYTTIGGSNNSPFFMLENQTPLTCDQFVKMTKEKLTAVVINFSCYSGHSFWIGAATTASACGVEDSHTDAGLLEEFPICPSSKRKANHSTSKIAK